MTKKLNILIYLELANWSISFFYILNLKYIYLHKKYII